VTSRTSRDVDLSGATEGRHSLVKPEGQKFKFAAITLKNLTRKPVFFSDLKYRINYACDYLNIFVLEQRQFIGSAVG
jgi:hypothetical protein